MGEYVCYNDFVLWRCIPSRRTYSVRRTMKKITALLVSIALLTPLCLIPHPVQAAITLGDANYTTLSEVGENNSCYSTQGMAVSDNYVYSAQIGDNDARSVIYRVDKATGTTVLMKNGSTNLTYFTNMGHANCMDIAVVNGVEYLCVLLLNSPKIILFRISDTTLYYHGEYTPTDNGRAFSPSAMSVYQVSGNTVTFLCKWKQNISKGSVDISKSSGSIPVTLLCKLDYSKIRVNGKIQDFSSFTNQGMGYYNNYLFVPITGHENTSTINQSLILGYDLTKASNFNTVQPDPDKIFHVVSYKYRGLFEIEDVDIDKNGQMYFNTNSRVSSSDTKHDGVFRLNDYTFGRTKPAATAPVLRDSAFTEIAQIPTTAGCTGNQGMAVGDDYLYSVQIKSSDNSRAVIHRIDKKTGADTVMTDGATGLNYFTNLNHANCADWGRVNGVEYLYVLASAKIIVLRIDGSTLTQCAEYNLKYNGNTFGPGGFALYKVSATQLTFLFKWNGVSTQSTISTGSISINATSGNISVTPRGYADLTELPIDESYLTPSGWLTQGMDCVDDMLYLIVTGNHVDATINHSLVIGYDLTKFTGNNRVRPEVKDILYIVSDNYPGLFEVEDVGFDRDGKMYFNTNGWKVKNGANADGVYVMNDFRAELPPPSNNVPILGDEAYTTIAKLGEANSCYSTQGFTVGGKYLYSAQAGSDDVYTVVHRVHKETGEHVLMKDGATGLTYFDTLNHANDMDYAKIDGVEYLFVLGAYRILVYRIDGDTLYHHATYNLYAHGNAFAPAGMTVKEITDTHITFLFKWQTTISTASVARDVKNTDLHVSILFYAEYNAVPLDGETKDLSGFSNQGFFYEDGYLFSVLAGASKTETIDRSVILGYHIENVASYSSVYPQEDLVFYIVSEDYPGLFEIESCAIGDDGRLYFNTNGRVSASDTKHDGVFVMNDFLFGGPRVIGSITSMNPGKPMEIRLMQNGVAVKTVTIAAGSGTGETAQTFAFGEVTPGTYDLQIVKAGHLPYTVTGIPVSDIVDLSDLLSHTPLIPGDINEDTVVDLQDLIILTADNTFNRSVANAQTPAADVNGDGLIDLQDLIILTADSNFNKGATVLPFTP